MNDGNEHVVKNNLDYEYPCQLSKMKNQCNKLELSSFLQVVVTEIILMGDQGKG